MSDKESESATSVSDEESSTSEEEDEDGKEWTEDIERTFLKTLSSLKSKNPKIYDTNVKFFKDETIKADDDSQPTLSKKKPKEERMYLRDYERKIIVEKGGILTDDESDDEAGSKKTHKRAASPTYVEEQKALIKAFFANDDEATNEDEDTDGYLKMKVKNVDEQEKEDGGYVEWLKGQKTELSDEETEEQLKYLRDYWTDPKLNEGEQFLRDYILNKRHLELNEENPFEEEVSFSEEEKILNECEEYEQQYNFRFEEPDQNFIKTYPRVIEDSLRRKNEKRKHKREERKKRKEELLRQKQIEVKRLKKQKKEELMEKINKLKELIGNETLGFDDDNLEADFNPDEYDKKMNELFNEEFYANENCDLDPNFEYDEVEDSEDPTHFQAEENDPNVDDGDFIMDCDYDPGAESESKFKKQTRSSRRKGHKRTTFAEVVQKEKPLFNPKDKNFQQYLDEYYGLEFEDVIDDLPCRFKYRKVMPNNFGLTVEEILAADDKELNNWCTMKKIDTIRPEHNETFDKKVYDKRAKNIELKKKFLPSLFTNEDTVEVTEQGTNKKKKKRRRKRKLDGPGVEQETAKKRKLDSGGDDQEIFGKKKKLQQRVTTQEIIKKNETALDANQRSIAKNNRASLGNNQEIIRKKKKSISGPIQENTVKKKKYVRSDASQTNSNKTNKNKGKLKSKREKDNFVMSDERLKAYGLNPKKYKNKMKYNQTA